MSKVLRVLHVEDSEDDAQLILRALRRGGYEEVISTRVETPEAMQAALRTETWDVILSDHAMPHFSGPAALELFNGSGLDVPFLIISGKIGEERAVELMRAGARDYILKENLARLVPAVERELLEAEKRRQHRQLEAQYRQAQKMEALGQLAGGVAHDFNNLLTIINGFSELLLSTLGPDDPSRPMLEQIKHAGDRSALLTRQLLIFSRKQTPSMCVLDLNSIIADSEKMLRRMIREDVSLVTELSARLHRVKADPGQLEQILFNLVVNARDAIPKVGRITIRTRNMTFTEGYSPPPDIPLGTYVLLEVEDTGTGMTPEVQARIFEPFFTTKEEGKGTGLGLATVFGIVKQSDGYIVVESKPGAGTIFRIYLPEVAEETTDQGNRHTEQEVASRGQEVVLLAEDEVNIRQLFKHVLVRNGYTVLDAGNGREAMQVAEQYRFPISILITDAVMPEMGGLELAQQLRTVHPETKFLCVSGYQQQLLDPNDNDLGIHFMRKPLSPAALTRKVRDILDNHNLKSGKVNVQAVAAGSESAIEPQLAKEAS